MGVTGVSVYEVKAGTQPDDDKAAALGLLLLSLFNQERTREAERLFRLSEQRAQYLADSSLRFVATSEHLSKTLEVADDLDWSPATVGLCKAVEMEVNERIMRPLAASLIGQNLEPDVWDKDLGRVAKYCSRAVRTLTMLSPLTTDKHPLPEASSHSSRTRMQRFVRHRRPRRPTATGMRVSVDVCEHGITRSSAIM